ncbi:lysine N(6)-hydroxylase/L-ornithine N(5)-oxygenase family protein [Streptomyces cinereospinus]|uniref:L-lysine N6-monooxygenase MbtG n=1 Tax=Streptomyces cinereospinus TaxID=285561 RepID=A0ABV5MXI5_9ACTN
MKQQHVELLAIGAGPANLALAVALEEMAPDDLVENTLVVEKNYDIAWQRGLLLPWTQSQVSFLKDLVTLRNPRSAYSFVNYLHATGRLDEFVNLGTFTPYRLEISRYLEWVASSLPRVRLDYGRQVVAVEPFREGDRITGWLVRFADESTVHCRDISFGIGRDRHVPEQFAQLPDERVVHSTEFTAKVSRLDPAAVRRIVVVGGAQSAAEMLWASYQQFPQADCTMVMRSIGLDNYDSSKFTNELFYPSSVDTFFAASPEARAQQLQEIHRSNYGGLAPGLLDSIYREMYLERLQGGRRLSMVTMTDVADAQKDGDEVVLTLVDRRTGRTEELRCDVVLLGTGFSKRMPAVVRDLAAAIGLDEIAVDRSYRMVLPETATARCYLQGVNEATHGIADSLISVLAVRSGEIVTDLLAGRHPGPPPAGPDPGAAGLLLETLPQN